MTHERLRIGRLAQQTRHVAHEDEPARLERDRGLRRGNVGVAIVERAVVPTRRRTDHRRDAAANAFAQRLDVDFVNFAHKTKIDRPARLVVRRKFPAPKNFRAGETARLPAEFFDRCHDFRIDLAGKNVVDQLDRGRIGHALALQKCGR